VRKVRILLVPILLLLAAFAGEALPLRDTDAAGRVTEYGHDERGNLLEARHPGGTRKYRWDERGLLREMEDERGGKH
jgi:YD repeat-containing protein